MYKCNREKNYNATSDHLWENKKALKMFYIWKDVKLYILKKLYI